MQIRSLILTIGLFPGLAFAQGLPEASPAVGLSASGVRRIDSVMTRYTAADRFPGG